MNKKYKLIKEYPGSNKKGLVIHTLNPDYYVKYPEFWEEIKEKEFTILSFKVKYLNRFYNLDKHSGFYSTGDPTINYTLDEMFTDGNLNVNTGGISIYSIRRESDGKIFTIGDKVIYLQDISYISEKPKNIIRFELEGSKIRVVIENYKFWYLETVKHCKQSILTTEDGVDIYPGDSLWTASDIIGNVFSNPIHVGTADWKAYEKNYNVKGSHPNHKHFSTKEKAEEYIIMNKPCLSINDVIKEGIHTTMNNNMNTSVIKNVYSDLIKLVKSKLNL